MTRLLGVQIANGYSPEARVFAQLLSGRRDRYEVQVIHQAVDQKDTLRFKEASGSSLIPVDTGYRPTYHSKDPKLKAAARISFLLRFPLVMHRLTQKVRDWKPDVIYSCQQKWDCRAATLLAKRLGVPQIIHLHYIVGPFLGKQPLERLLDCDHVITVSNFIREQALQHGVAPDRITPILNAMRPLPEAVPGIREQVRQEFSLPSDALLVGIVSRIDPFKGHEDTIEAFSAIAEAYPSAYLLIVGDGLLLGKIREKIRAKGMEKRILACGYRSDVPRLLGAMDVFIHPSRHDPCPLATLEAAAAGLPIVAYDEGGVRELAIQGETGLLAPAGDVGSLSRCLGQLLKDPVRARQMGAASRIRMATHFRPEDAATKFACLIEQVARH